MKVFLSADMEGTCGIVCWPETERTTAFDYTPLQKQMSREVAAACAGAVAAGAEDILLKDAHDTARNLDPTALPRETRILRGWTGDPLSMMSGLDSAPFGAVLFTGYHAWAACPGNPLSHTMNGQNNHVKVNGQVCSELMMNSLTAAMFGVPVLMVTGDRMLCDWFHTVVPQAVTVPVSYGIGNGSVSIHPDKAVRLIREAAEKAVTLPGEQCLFPMPEHFTVEVNYKQHYTARSASWYPGARQEDSRTVIFESDRWMDVLTFFHYCL